MGSSDTPKIVSDPVRMTAQRISIFPLSGAIIFPSMQLPLHIFEPRYRDLVSDSLARDRKIGIIQPKGQGNQPPLFNIGCLARIHDVEALDDGRYNIILEGVQRFSVINELNVTTSFRQVEAELWDEDEMSEALSLAERASIEIESRRFADSQGYSVDRAAVSQLDDYSLVNAIAQIAPFDFAAKQALLEARGLSDRAAIIVQLMQFFGRHDGSDDRVTLQ
jgi:Lon protease-like protein